MALDKIGRNVIDFFPCVAFVNFNGVPISGTYSRIDTLVSINITGHGLTTGMKANLDFTSGTASDGTYVVTVTDANNFTVTDTVSGSTSGNVTANVRIRSSGNISNVVRNSTGDYTISFTTAMLDTNYTVLLTRNGSLGTDFRGALLSDSTAPTISSFRIITPVITGSFTMGGNDASNVFVGVLI